VTAVPYGLPDRALEAKETMTSSPKRRATWFKIDGLDSGVSAETSREVPQLLQLVARGS